MKKIAIALGAAALIAGTAVFAQDNSNRNYPYDVDTVTRQQQLETRVPYLAPNARDSLGSGAWYEDPATTYGTPRREWRDDRFQRRYDNAECWNPRARHYEEVRRGERQDDLDFSRCRTQRYGR